MKWNCDDCGACCVGMQVRARATGDWAEGQDGYAVNAALKKKRLPLIGQDGMMPTKDEACVALDTKTRRCTIYETRPWVCKAFQIASPQCLVSRVLMGIDTVPDPIEFLRGRGSWGGMGTQTFHSDKTVPAGLINAWAVWFRAQGREKDAKRVEAWILEDARRRTTDADRLMPTMLPNPGELGKQIYLEDPKPAPKKELKKPKKPRGKRKAAYAVRR